MARLKQLIGLDPRSDLKVLNNDQRARLDALLRDAAAEVVARAVITADWYCGLDTDERIAIGAALADVERDAHIAAGLDQLRASVAARSQARDAFAQIKRHG